MLNSIIILPIPVIVVSHELSNQYRINNVLIQIGYTEENIYFSNNFVEAKQLLDQNSASCAIVDISANFTESISFIKLLKYYDPSIMVLAISHFKNRNNMLNALSAGATGYCYTQQSDQDLLNSARITIQGGAQIDADIALQILDYFDAFEKPTALNPTAYLDFRDRQILNWVIKGFNTQEIAKKLNVSQFSIESFVKLIYQKINL
ncbi:LuxR C-terminal-related transcriptional regulator [Acinetobacter gerneri]|jgi:DNA-binding NarL/FixJ family response regulator|uniref:LuxR C-terminal-related transcriptional regulator n=1 Tax=Acinetobacter gerneri TaxID=202952 RepID=UPI0023F19FF1|nr:LuxR C-terminal-related transcriptional regulator [Acinetobacter gerneri]MCH4242956.1 LuxR C-terminal-related transcriptional regulator [Acinetobacter gerneri]